MNVADVFISYSRMDHIPAGKLAKELQKRKVSYWLDVENVQKDRPYDDQIPGDIRDCKAVVFLISENSLSSDEVKSELRCAKDFRKPLILLMLEEAELREAFQYHANAFHRIDAVRDWDAAIRELMDSLKTIAGIRISTREDELAAAGVVCPKCRYADFTVYDDWLTRVKNHRLCLEYAQNRLYNAFGLPTMMIALPGLLFWGLLKIFSPDYVMPEVDAFLYKSVILLMYLACAAIVGICVLIQKLWEHRRRSRVRQHICVEQCRCNQCLQKFQAVISLDLINKNSQKDPAQNTEIV